MTEEYPPEGIITFTELRYFANELKNGLGKRIITPPNIQKAIDMGILELSLAYPGSLKLCNE